MATPHIRAASSQSGPRTQITWCCRCVGVSGYLSGGQLCSPAGEREGPGRPAAHLQVDGRSLQVNGRRLQRLRGGRLLPVDVWHHHGNGSFGRHHRDGDALSRRPDEGQRLRPHGTTPHRQLLRGDTEDTSQMATPTRQQGRRLCEITVTHLCRDLRESLRFQPPTHNVFTTLIVSGDQCTTIEHRLEPKPLPLSKRSLVKGRIVEQPQHHHQEGQTEDSAPRR